MKAEEFQRLKEQCKPSGSYSSATAPAKFYPSTFQNSLLPSVRPYCAKDARFYDGADLLKGSLTNDKTLKISNEEIPYSIWFFSYPKGVEAAKQRANLQVSKSEVCAFLEISQDDKIDVYFTLNPTIEKFLSNYYVSKKLPDISKTIKSKVFKTDIIAVRKYFNKSISHFSLFSFIFKTLNIEVTPKTKYIVSDAYFAKKEKDVFAKVKTAKLEDELYVVVEGTGLEGLDVHINIFDKNNTISIVKKNERLFVPVTMNNEGIITIVAKFVKGTQPNSFIAAAKINLNPKSLEDLRATYNNMANANSKKAYLYLLVDIYLNNKRVETDVLYQGKNSDPKSIPNYWLDNEGEYLEVGYCDCGYEYIGKFLCVPYGGSFGTQHAGTKALVSYDGWDKLISEKKLTEDEKEIMIAMSPNEGNLDTVQSYDFLDGKPIILTAGAMQKIVDPQGNGNEFPKQVAEFKKDFPDKYQTLFENCGWIVEKGIMYYKEFSETEKITGRPLADKIRKNCNKDNVKKPVRCKPLEAIAKAIIDSDFQAKQVQDFIVRLNNVLAKTPTGANKKDYEKYKLKDFLKSKLGRATALDHDINRPAHVAFYFGEALNRFFAEKDKEIDEKNENIVDIAQKLPKVSRNPNDWGDNHSSFETELLEIYGALRGEKLTSEGAPKGTPMTNATKRYTDLKKRL